MPTFEVGPARAISAIDSRLARETRGQGQGPVQAREQVARAMVKSDALDAGQPPVDSDRVSVIRKAIENGTYPVIPAKIADAVVAAGLLLRTRK
ncbi:MAG: flagellar biosynthesis anti-sigma factor FlgM [Novosphingobium sp.]